jgi:hypothetical protein
MDHLVGPLMTNECLPTIGSPSADDALQARDATIRTATTDNTCFTRFIACFISSSFQSLLG